MTSRPSDRAVAMLAEEVRDLLESHPAATTYPDGPCIEREQRKLLRAALDAYDAARELDASGGGAVVVAYQRRSHAGDGKWTRWSEWDERDRDEAFPATTGRWQHEYRPLYTAPPAPADAAVCPYVVTSREGTSYCSLNGPADDAGVRDAARYRFLRGEGPEVMALWLKAHSDRSMTLTRLDAAIDEAIAASTQEGG